MIHPGFLIRQMFGLEPDIKPDISKQTLKLGDKGADWTIIPDLLDCGSVVYSVGVGTNISFDLELIKMGALVYAFDPTPRSIKWLEKQSLPKMFFFNPWGLGDKDKTETFIAPSGVNVSYRKGLGKDSFAVFKYKTLMKKLNHLNPPKLLKMDIEGFEYGVVDDIVRINRNILPEQLLVEFHHRFSGFSKKDTLKAVARLRNIGYKLYSISAVGQEYSFLLV